MNYTRKEMDYQQLLDAVRRMRQLQKDYFRTRSPYTLNESKRAERDVDALLKKADAAQVPQPGDLFSNELEGRIINNPQRDLCTIEAKTSQIHAIAERYPDGTRVTITITPKP